MQQTTQIPAETQTPVEVPRRLDGVVVDSCTFTESVSKREPRPPLHHGFNKTEDGVKLDLGGVLLAIPGARVVVVEPTLPPGHIWDNGAPIVGLVFPGAPIGPRYTGPITPAMWAVIRKWWQP